VGSVASVSGSGGSISESVLMYASASLRITALCLEESRCLDQLFRPLRGIDMSGA